MATKKTTKKALEGEFAIIQTGGKQYTVMPGETIKIEKITGEFKEGDKITFDKVLLVDNGSDLTTIGTPFVDGASVVGIFEKEGRHDKVTVIKYKAKSRYFKKNGHRQPYFQVRIEAIK
jgi:large subunit ribosomal protein L21